MTLDVGIGIHSTDDGWKSRVIRRTTEMCCPRPWAIGPDSPATHAYVWWTHGDGLFYRLDGQPPHALEDHWQGPCHPTAIPSAHWRLVPGPHCNVVDAWRRALELAGTPYNRLELITQPAIIPVDDLVDALGRANLAPPALADAVRHVRDMIDHVHSAMICTSIATEVLRASGQLGGGLVDAMRDRFPERLGHHAARAEGSLLERVRVVG